MTAHIFPGPPGPYIPPDEGLPLTVYQEVLRLLTERVPEDLFRSIVPTVLQQALPLLDPLRRGLVMSVLLCTPPANARPIRSLSIHLSQGTPPLSEEISPHSLFFGVESLAASAVLSEHAVLVPDISDPHERQLFVGWGSARCIASYPLKRFGRCAGCLTVASAFSLLDSDLALLQDAAYLIGFALPEQDFFPVEQMAFQVMPPIEIQSTLFATYRQRFLGLIDEARRNGQALSIPRAERLALQQLEEELVQLASPRNRKGVKVSVRA